MKDNTLNKHFCLESLSFYNLHCTYIRMCWFSGSKQFYHLLKPFSVEVYFVQTVRRQMKNKIPVKTHVLE